MDYKHCIIAPPPINGADADINITIPGEGGGSFIGGNNGGSSGEGGFNPFVPTGRPTFGFAPIPTVTLRL